MLRKLNLSKITEFITAGPGFRPRAAWLLPTGGKKKKRRNVGSHLKGRDLKCTEK